MNKDMINALPVLLKRLSNGEGLHIPTLSQQLDIPQKTLQDNIKKHLVPIGVADIKFDKSLQKWIAKRGFLSETLLSEYELVTIQLLEVHASRYGRQFLLSTQRLFSRFKQRASLEIFKKTKIEKIDKDDEGKLAIIKTGISQKRVLYCKYREKERIVYPLKIVLLEGFWYLFLWDSKDEIIKTFHLKTIKALVLQDEEFVVPKNNVIDHLDNAINAYFKDAELIPVRLYVHKKVSKYFKRQPLSSSQTIKPYDADYDQMDIWVTDEMEIIPTIQQYLPYVKVDSPDSLHKRIEENINNYSNHNLSK